MDSQVSIIKCANYGQDLVEVSVRKAINLIGGVAHYIKPGSRVLVKPNILMAKAPEFGIDTHPEVVRAVIRVLKDNNCHVFVGDGPSVWGKEIENVDEVYRISGIAGICHEEKVELVRFDKRRMREKFPLAAALDECDYLINIPKFKTHEFTLISGGIKNLFGLVSGTFKTELHKNYFQPSDFAGILVDIYQQTRPALTIIDGILAMEGDGPATSGKTRNLNLLMAGADCVALDTVMAKIMGIKGQEVLSTKEAYTRKLGEGDLAKIQITGEDLGRLNIRPFILPKSSAKIGRLPKPLRDLVKNLIRYYPYSLPEKCSRCGHCIGICPSKCIAFPKNKKKSGLEFDYKKCIACFCCQEACPEAAIAVKKSRLARLIGL